MELLQVHACKRLPAARPVTAYLAALRAAKQRVSGYCHRSTTPRLTASVSTRAYPESATLELDLGLDDRGASLGDQERRSRLELKDGSPHLSE